MKYPWRDVYFGNLWQVEGCLPCHIQSQMVEHCLLKKFPQEDLRLVWGVTWNPFLIHNFLQVRTNTTWMSIDPWGQDLGIPLGKNIFDIKIEK